MRKTIDKDGDKDEDRDDDDRDFPCIFFDDLGMMPAAPLVLLIKL